ncbi:MAG: hypothetical protein P8169_09075, partial [Chloroflexota bacterium]
MALLAGVIAGAVWLFNTVRDIASASQNTNELVEFTPGDDLQTDALPDLSQPAEESVEEEPLPVIIADELEPWSGTERVNILFLGTDQR